LNTRQAVVISGDSVVIPWSVPVSSPFLRGLSPFFRAIKNRPASVLEALRAHESAGIGISSVSMAELFFGAMKSGSERNLQALRHFL
jgi:hypothetical protein